MYDRVCYILAELNCLPLRLQKSAAAYLVFLMLTIKKHDFQSAGKLMECDPSCFCRLLNSDGREQLTRIVLNRAKRRHLQALSQRLGVSLHERNVIIIDATIMGRHGKVENLGKFNHGKGSVKGHMFVNFVYLGADGVSLVPLDSLPLYTKKYARENKLAYRTEAEIVEDWINDLPDAGYFAKEDMPNVLFLMDAGYDVKAIQNAVIGIKAHFVAALKSNRSVEGRNVSQYFRRHRNLAWSTIRLIVGSGGKGSRREYRTRHAKGVRLKGVGQASVVCSERKRSHRKTRKYLATNDPSFSAHDIVFWYSRRWLIELWHRSIKQGYGFCDCKCARFSAIEAHVNFCLTAYCLHHLLWDGQIVPKFTAADYLQMKNLQQAKKSLTQYGGKERVVALAAAELQRFKPAA